MRTKNRAVLAAIPPHFRQKFHSEQLKTPRKDYHVRVICAARRRKLAFEFLRDEERRSADPAASGGDPSFRFPAPPLRPTFCGNHLQSAV